MSTLENKLTSGIRQVKRAAAKAKIDTTVTNPVDVQEPEVKLIEAPVEKSVQAEQDVAQVKKLFGFEHSDRVWPD
jgi:cobalamin biosynthesis protein CbiD